MSFIYNLRLGGFGPLTAGETLRVALIPTPGPRELIVRLGPESPQGRQVMLEVTGRRHEDEAGPYHLVLSPQGAPQQAWTSLAIGKLSGQLLNPAAAMQPWLPGHPRFPQFRGWRTKELD